MPRKEIYIKDEHKELFDTAAEVLGEDSLSAAIATALQKAVTANKAEAKNMEEIELEIGSDTGNRGDTPNYKKVRFIGREIARYSELHGDDDTRGAKYILYLSGKGKFLLYIRQWSYWQGEGSSSEYHVFDSLQEVEEFSTPESLIRDARKKLGEDTAEFLDI